MTEARTKKKKTWLYMEMQFRSISFVIIFLKATLLHHFWNTVFCRGNAKKPLKILLLSIDCSTPRLINVLFSRMFNARKHEKYVARKHGFPILFFNTIYGTCDASIQVYPLSDFFVSLSIAEMNGAIFYPNWHLPILYATTYKKLLQFISYMWSLNANVLFVYIFHSNMHPFLVHFRLHVLATVKGILSCN